MDLQEAVKLLEVQRNKGKGILLHQPVQREICEAWTAATRKAIIDVFGPGSKRYRDLIAANRKIFTSFDTDPSYYLTQCVANLHRELKVIEQCVKEKEQEAEAEAALLAAKGIGKAKLKKPAFLWAESDGGTKAVKEALERHNFAVAARGDGGGGGSELLWELATQKDLAYAVVLVGGPKGKGGGPSPEGLLIAGYLTGRMGRARVLVLTDASQKMPEAAGFLRSVALQDAEKWQAEITADAAKVNG